MRGAQGSLNSRATRALPPRNRHPLLPINFACGWHSRPTTIELIHGDLLARARNLCMILSVNGATVYRQLAQLLSKLQPSRSDTNRSRLARYLTLYTSVAYSTNNASSFYRCRYPKNYFETSGKKSETRYENFFSYRAQSGNSETCF